MKRFFPIVVLPLTLAGLLSCGLEEYYYLDPVYESTIDMALTNTATVRLPSYDTAITYFSHFSIYYRIYISGVNPEAKVTTDDERGAINTALRSDWTAIKPSTDTTSTSVNTSISSTFTNRKYYELALEGRDINSALSVSSGGTLAIEFSSVAGNKPTLTINGNKYTLYRSNNDGVATPKPDRYFFNTPEICDSDNAKNVNINPDVADAQSGVAQSPRYTYVSMYIVAVGKDKLTTFYSIPTFIGIFKLPELN